MKILKKLFRGGSKYNKENLIKDGFEVNTFDNTKTIEKPINKDKLSIEDSCEQLVEALLQLEELKLEYHAVTSYLTDIQKIDQILEDEREELNEVVRQILTITKERAKYQTSAKRLSDNVYKQIALYEDTLPKELKQIQQNEIYQSKIDKDMKHLEGEKASLLYEKEDSLLRHKTLKNMGIMTSIFVVLLFILFIIIDSTMKVNIGVPFLMTVTMGLIVATYVIIQAGILKKDIALIEAKLNRAIILLNKVKIKYINNTNALDYAYEKYSVKSYTELEYLFEQYKKAKEDEGRFSKNTEELEYNNRELIKFLRRYSIEDPDVWIYQADAIIDSKEMVEVRHRLNNRRGKLRESMDYNTKLKEECVKRIKEYLSSKPNEKEMYEPLLRKHGIYIS